MAFGDLPKRPNIVIIISDQQSGHPYWPAGWEEANLPAMTRLKQTGITFNRGYTNSCTCSPARTTLFTGMYPAQHGVTEVLEFDNMSDPADGVSKAMKERRQQMLPSGMQNMAKMMKSAGYNVAYKGKWHLTKPVQYSNPLGQKYWTEADSKHIADRWGFSDWGMPDAGDNLAIANMGGGNTNNDGRFVDGNGQSAKYGYLPPEITSRQSVVHFLENYDSEQPFCLIVSLVNPHDVLAYPGTGASYVTIDGQQVPLYQAAGYRDEQFQDLPIEAPPTVNESLDTKPRAQAQFRALSNAGNGPITEDDTTAQQRYCQFYAYLCTQVDNEIAKVLAALDSKDLTKDTLVFRISDHGDMAMSHGRQRQKMYNVYQETLNVPFIVSNPVLFHDARSSDSLVSLIDIMPTLATIAQVPHQDEWTFKGNDITPIFFDTNVEVQKAVHFTFDDLYFYVPAANHIRCITEKDWKYALYYDIYGGVEPEYEMYDLAHDPTETRNLANDAVTSGLSPEERAAVDIQRQRLHTELAELMEAKGTTPDAIVWPKISGHAPLTTTDLPRNSPYAGNEGKGSDTTPS